MNQFQNYKYIFYDLETTGQNPCFDQVVRFAAKETDSNLNIINEHNISIQLRNDVLPHPKALLVNKLNIGDLKEGLVEYEAFSQIHQIMNQPNTINIGYNSLSFDDQFLSFGFYFKKRCCCDSRFSRNFFGKQNGLPYRQASVHSDFSDRTRTKLASPSCPSVWLGVYRQ